MSIQQVICCPVKKLYVCKIENHPSHNEIHKKKAWQNFFFCLNAHIFNRRSYAIR